MKRWILASAVALGAAVAMPGASADAVKRPLLLELFTSQGCSSCPPADALLAELAQRPELLPLEFHVDYWNDLGWVDPYSATAYTRRQQDYAAAHGFEVYTPQLVVEGRADVLGSSRGAVARAIAAAAREARGVDASITRSGDTVNLAVGTGTGGTAGVYLLSFDNRDITVIQAGENAGRKLAYVNVVRSLRKVGAWRGQSLQLAERLRPEERGDRLALLVQDGDGTVWAVASTPPLASNLRP